MLRNVKKLKGMKIIASDGEAGSIKDVYFDDEKWTIRHLQVDAGGWLTGRKVLVSPIAITRFDWDEGEVRINLTRQQIQDGPGLDEHKPVSRQHEEEQYQYFGYPYYWSGPYLWGYTVFPSMLEESPFEDAQRLARRENMEEGGNEIHLRSCDEVLGYNIRATDDVAGHADDFLFDEKDWSIRLIAVDTRKWWPGRHVLLPPKQVTRVSWEEKEFLVDVSRADIESSAEYDENNLAALDAEPVPYHQVNPPERPSPHL